MIVGLLSRGGYHKYLAIMSKILVIGFILVLLTVMFRGKGTAPEVPPTEENIREALIRGDKIQAIKGYRTLYQVSLVEAKDAVEQLEAKLKQDGFIQ